MISLSTKVVMLVVSAALLLSSSASAAPVLTVSPTSFSLQANAGTNVSARTVQISNPGNGILKWSVVAPTATWLSVAPTSGTNAGTLTLTFQTSTLAAGNYQTSFTVRTNSQSVTVNVQLAILSAPVLSVSPTSFSVQANVGSNVSARTVQVSNTGGGTLQWSVGASTATWLSESPTSGTNAGTITLTFQTSTLAAGNYTTSFTVQSGTQSVTVNVQLAVSSTPVLSVSPTSFSLQTSVGSNVSARTVQVSNTGGGTLQWSVGASTATWLSESPTSGTNAGTITLTFQTSTLAAGNYTTSFTVQSGTQSVTVNVQLAVSSTPVLSVSPTSFSLQTSVGSNVSARTVQVSNTGGGTLQWTVGASTATWLSESPTSGTNAGTITLTFQTSTLAAGNYTTSFTVQSGTQSVTVNVQLAVSSTPVLSVSPTSFSLQTSVGSNVSARTVQVSNTGGGTLQWTVGAPTATWLSVSPTSGTGAGTITLTFQTAALTAGNYTTSFAVQSGTQSVTVNVQVSIVTSSGGLFVSPTSFSLQAYAGANVASKKVQITNTSGLPWSVVAPAVSWFSVTPTSGTLGVALTLTFQTPALTVGNYQTSFTVQTSAQSFTVDVQLSILTPPPSTIYVSPTGADANSGVQTSPVQTIQRAVTLANGVNSTGVASRVVIAAGVYRESVVLDIADQQTDAAMVIEGAGSTSTILTGTDDWSTGWVVAPDGTLTHYWPFKWGMKPIPTGWEFYWTWGGLGYKRDALRRSETVYVNGQPLRLVLTLPELVAGTFYVDETGELLYVRLPTGQTLASSSIEVGMRVSQLRLHGRRNVTIRNLGVVRNRGAVQDSAVSVTNSRNIAFEGMQFRWVAYGALNTAYNTTLRVRSSVISDNGVMAFSAFRDVDVIMENTEIARNNAKGWAAEHKGWDVVFKWMGIRDGLISRSNIINNWGNGLHIDGDNKRITIEYSLMGFNQSKGLSLEKNQGPITVNGNRMCNNVSAGLNDAQSDYVTLTNNQIFNNRDFNFAFGGVYTGQTITDWQTGQPYTAKSLYWTFTGNVLSGSGTATTPENGGWLWWHTNYNAPGAWELIRSTFVKFDSNKWYHSNRTTSFKLPEGSVDYSGFVNSLKITNPMFELNSSWQSTILSCTMP